MCNILNFRAVSLMSMCVCIYIYIYFFTIPLYIYRNPSSVFFSRALYPKKKRDHCTSLNWTLLG